MDMRAPTMKIAAQILRIVNHQPNTQPEQKAKMKVTVEFEPGDEITKAGIDFLVAKAGESLEEYAKDALLMRLEMDEDAGIGHGYFEKLRSDFWTLKETKQTGQQAAAV